MGDKNANIGAWLDSVEMFLDATGEPKTEWPKIVLSYFAEVPLAKVNKARVGEDKPDYDDFRRKLIVLLGKPEPVELYTTKLRQIRQMPAEAITDYAERVMDTVVRAYPEADEKTKVEMASSTFVDGLSDP